MTEGAGDLIDRAGRERGDSEGSEGAVGGGGGVGGVGEVGDFVETASSILGVGGGGFLGGGIMGGGKSAAVGEVLEAGGKPAARSSSCLISTHFASSYKARP